MQMRILLGLVLMLLISTAGAALEPSQVREALPKKTESYLKEGIISGGDREIHAGIVKDVRRATNGGFERIVIDIEAEKAPYYQAAIDPTRRRILVTLFGSPKLAFNAKKIVESFRKSPLIARIEFFPLIEEDAWTFALYLKAAVPVEVFELTAPTRIIFDLKGGASLISELAPTPKAAVTQKAAKKTAARVRVVPTARKPIRANPIEDDDEGNGATAHDDDIPE